MSQPVLERFSPSARERVAPAPAAAQSIGPISPIRPIPASSPEKEPKTISDCCRGCRTPGDGPHGHCYLWGRPGITYCVRRT